VVSSRKMLVLLKLLLAALLLHTVAGCSADAKAASLSKILTDLPVSAAQKHVQQTPIDNRNGTVYVANIEPGSDGDQQGINLHTIIRKGVVSGGNWQWSSTLIEDRTVHDEWHTAPALALDKAGFIHIAYNMHNFPWQYKVSARPDSIDAFEFRGQTLSLDELKAFKYENKTTFKTMGSAAIPGNQVTYPSFYKDNNKDLYVTYRFAAKPKKRFKSRAMSAGISRYNVASQAWTSIGAPLDIEAGDFQPATDPEKENIPNSIASASGWTVYHPRLVFDSDNRMHVNWFWREGIAGSIISRPCYVKSDDQIRFTDAAGTAADLPMQPLDCSNMGVASEQEFYSIGNTTINSAGEVHILLSPKGQSRQIHQLVDGQWSVEKAPKNTSEIFFDTDDNLWAIGTGLVVYVRKKGENTWQTVHSADDKTYCYPRASLNEDKSIAYIYSLYCREDLATVFQLDLDID